MSVGIAKAEPDVSAMERSVVRVVLQTADGFHTGSGFVLNSAGDVATNHHVIESNGRLFILANNSREQLAASVIWKSRTLDLAVLKVAGLNSTPVQITKAKPKKGVHVYALGFPGAADADGVALDATLTNGIIGRLFNGSWEEDADSLSIIQHSAPVNPGNSGGPLFDACGRVVGVNTAKHANRIVRDEHGDVVKVETGEGIYWASHINELVRELSSRSIPYNLSRFSCTEAGAAFWQTPLWNVLLVALVCMSVLLALRKPRQKIVHVVENYSRKLSHSVARAQNVKRTGDRSKVARDGPRASPSSVSRIATGSRIAQLKKETTHGLLLSGFSASGHPLRIRVEAAALNAAPTGLSVGRDAALTDMQLQDAQISRRHIRFGVAGKNIIVEDLNSTNGTRLNGKRINPFELRKVHAGDTLRLGSIDFTVSQI